MNYYSHHIGDFDKATRHLTRIERSVYRDLMDVYYDTEQPLTLDRPALCRKIIARSNEEATAVEQVLNEFFIETPGGWAHIRCEEELEKYRASTSQKSAAGKASAAARAAIKQQALNACSTSVPTAVEQTLNGSATNQEPITKNQRKPKPSSSAGADGDGEKIKPFDRFWEAYPKRVAKIAAQKAWSKLKLDGKADDIVAAIEAQKVGHHWCSDGGRFIPHPASWLNAGCWLDEVVPYTPPPPKLPAGWWESKEGMERAGAMLTPPLTARKGEYPKEFAARIREALGQVDPAPNAAPAAAPAPYVPPAPPAGVQLTPEQKAARQADFRAAMAQLKQASANADAGVPA